MLFKKLKKKLKARVFGSSMGLINLANLVTWIKQTIYPVFLKKLYNSQQNKN